MSEAMSDVIEYDRSCSIEGGLRELSGDAAQSKKKADAAAGLGTPTPSVLKWTNVAGAWQANFDYKKDALVVDASSHSVFRAMTDGRSGGAAPVWQLGDIVTTDNTVKWSNQGTAAAWKAKTPYKLDAQVFGKAQDGKTYLFKVVAEGTSGDKEPTWPASESVTEQPSGS